MALNPQRDSWVMSDVARRLVYYYVKNRLEKTDTHVTFGLDEVYVVMSCFVLGNWKVLASTTLPDAMYYEVTYDVEENKAYIDAYKKWENVQIELDADGGPRDAILPGPPRPFQEYVKPIGEENKHG
jgi:hypothetical protein